MEEQRKEEAVDPLWLKAGELVASRLTVNLMAFLSRLTDTAVFVSDMLDLHAKGKHLVFARKLRGLPQYLAAEPSIFKVNSAEERTKAMEFMTRAIQKTLEDKIQKYSIWILNQGLVTLCTVLDAPRRTPKTGQSSTRENRPVR